MNKNKNCAQEIRQVKVPQLALPPTGPCPRLKSPNCRYTRKYHVSRSYLGEIKREKLNSFTILFFCQITTFLMYKLNFHNPKTSTHSRKYHYVISSDLAICFSVFPLA